MDDYEAEYSYQLVYATLEEAIKNNEGIMDTSQIPWIKRDTKMMKWIMKK